MRVVVADTGPLNYLVLIGAIDLIPKLFGRVLIPEVVRAELCHPGAPPLVRDWANRLPEWVDVRDVSSSEIMDPALTTLDDGEAAALALVRSVGADLVLMDDRAGAAVAKREGFAVTGTLGVLALAARHGFIDLAEAFGRLKATNFRYRPEILDTLLARHVAPKR
ncbi:MAG TPA: DUF3368 domain-containing protein [Stellaceae bacterium]|nr:DUF3368 domain-containing protein [Stellaceae bacterium]